MLHKKMQIQKMFFAIRGENNNTQNATACASHVVWSY